MMAIFALMLSSTELNKLFCNIQKIVVHDRCKKLLKHVKKVVRQFFQILNFVIIDSHLAHPIKYGK